MLVSEFMSNFDKEHDHRARLRPIRIAWNYLCPSRTQECPAGNLERYQSSGASDSYSCNPITAARNRGAPNSFISEKRALTASARADRNHLQKPDWSYNNLAIQLGGTAVAVAG